MAVLYTPVVRLKSASAPSAVLPLGYAPSGAGLNCARVVGEIASHARTRARAMRTKPYRKGLRRTLPATGVDEFIGSFFLFSRRCSCDRKQRTGEVVPGDNGLCPIQSSCETRILLANRWK